LALTVLTCPNCSAPLDAKSGLDRVKCLYCGSQVVPREVSKQGLGAGCATERIAAELSLRRLIREKDVFLEQLSELAYQRREPDRLAMSAWLDKLREFESAKAEKLNKILTKQIVEMPDFLAYKFFFAALLVSAIWLFSDWTWLWIVVFGLIFGSVVAWILHLNYKAAYKQVKASKPPECPPRISPEKSQQEKDVEDRIAEIDSEIAQHLAFLESTKPTGTSKEPEREDRKAKIDSEIAQNKAFLESTKPTGTSKEPDDTMPWFSPS
jgi:hypothetical protein